MNFVILNHWPFAGLAPIWEPGQSQGSDVEWHSGELGYPFNIDSSVEAFNFYHGRAAQGELYVQDASF